MRSWLLILMFGLFLNPLGGQVLDTIRSNIFRQLDIFPQEKVYLMTDKSAYVSGESIWFRAFLTDAQFHCPELSLSRYLYVDLIDPNGVILKHHQIIPDSCGVFHNRLELDSDMAEGTYLIRAYTAYMRAQEEYIFEKRVFITDPQSAVILVEPEFTVSRDRDVTVFFRFRNLIDSSLISIETVKIKVGGANMQEFPAKRPISFRGDREKAKYLYIAFTHAGRQFAKYVTIPYSHNALFDLSFHPEGGYLIEKEASKVGFKCVGSNGLSQEVTGTIYDSKGQEITAFQSLHAGMGFFPIVPEPGESYYALVSNGDSTVLRFELPKVHANGCFLRVDQRSGLYIISAVDRRIEMDGDLFLLVHIRGSVLFAEQMSQRNRVVLSKDGLPPGIISILLLDHEMNPLSERLVFNKPSEFAQVAITSDQNKYLRRAPVGVGIALQLPKEYALDGSFALSITDNSDILPDSTMTITSYLLLSSDLRGAIEDAGFYLSGHANATNALDALMLTQGWRRYNMPDVIQGVIESPKGYIEMGRELSGLVKGLFGGKPVSEGSVMALMSGINFIGEAATDQWGRFVITLPDFPDSTRIILYGKAIGEKRVELTLDDQEPLMMANSVPSLLRPEDSRFDHFITKANQQHIDEYGIKTYQISGAVVTANKPNDGERSLYSSVVSESSVPQRIVDQFKTDIVRLLGMYHGTRIVVVDGEKVVLGADGRQLLIVLDDNILFDEFSIENLSGVPIKRVEVLKAPHSFVFGARLGMANNFPRDVLLITTDQEAELHQSHSFHSLLTVPQGYKKAVEFYSPKYETVQQRTNPKPDLRTTLYWKPNLLLTEDGKATIEFYTADANSTYTLLLEGITSEGVVIRQTAQIFSTETTLP